MENASKALLIAGAILIAILLIAIGMMVFTSASGVIDTATSNMSSQEKTMFNKQWTIYGGTQSGSTIIELCNQVGANNSNDDNVDVIVTGKATVDESGKVTTTDIVKQSQYKVEVTDTNNDGVIDQIKISQN